MKAESSSKNTKIVELKAQIESLNQKLLKSEESNKELSEKLQKSNEEIERVNALASNLYQEYAILAKEKDSDTMKFEIAQNHMETKIRLLKENKDYQIAEDNNKELVAFIEKCDEKISKLDEDLQIEKIKTEKYEIKLGLIEDDFKRIDVDTLDGRINFLVNLLEQYRKMLEEESLTSDDEDKQHANDYVPSKPKFNNKRKEKIDGRISDIDDEDKVAIMYAKHKRKMSI